MTTACMSLLSSCSNEEMPSLKDGDTTVNLKITLPQGARTRAFADGLSATQLYFAVYQLDGTDENPTYTLVGGTEEGVNSSYTFTDLEVEVPIKLVNGVSYSILFWAQDPTCEAYTIDWENRTLKVDYDQMTPGSETVDAFYTMYDTGLITAPLNDDITLYRPLAQINFGTNDATEPTVVQAFGANLATCQTQLTVSDVYENFDFTKGNVTGEPISYAFPATAVPQNEIFPVEGEYTYLSMNYVLVNMEAGITDLTFTVSNGTKDFNTFTVNDAGVQGNHRTNVFGQLLTSTNNFKVIIDPEFNVPDFNIEYNVWDGTTTTVPDITTAEDGSQSVEINNPEQLAGLAELVEKNSLENVVVNLNDSYDMSKGDFNSIGSTENPFKGTFNGNGRSITGTNAALFTAVEGATVKNLTLSSSDATYSALIVAASGNTSISGVTVKGTVSKSSDPDKYGASGFVSHVTGNLTIDNCYNYADVTDDSYCGSGFVGRGANSNVEISNSTNYGTITSNRPSGAKAAGFFGLTGGSVKLTNCINRGEIIVNCEGSASAAGGIIAWTADELNLSNCVNYGKVSMTLTGTASTGVNVVGGIVGGNGFCSKVWNISGCVNNGSVNYIAQNIATEDLEYSHGIYVGGILGSTEFNNATVTGCTNNGSLSVEQGENKLYAYVGGIIGGFGWATFSVTNSTVASTTQMTGGNLEAALYNNISKNINTVISETGNINKTSYPDVLTRE